MLDYSMPNPKDVQEEIFGTALEIKQRRELSNTLQPNVQKMSNMIERLKLEFGDYLERSKVKFYETHVDRTPNIEGFITFIHQLLVSFTIIDRLTVFTESCLPDIQTVTLKVRLNILLTTSTEVQLYLIETYFELAELNPRTAAELCIELNSSKFNDFKFDNAEDKMLFNEILCYPMFRNSLEHLKPQKRTMNH